MGKKKKNKKKWNKFNYSTDKSSADSEQIRAIAFKVFGSNYYSAS